MFDCLMSSSAIDLFHKTHAIFKRSAIVVHLKCYKSDTEIKKMQLFYMQITWRQKCNIKIIIARLGHAHNFPATIPTSDITALIPLPQRWSGNVITQVTCMPRDQEFFHVHRNMIFKAKLQTNITRCMLPQLQDVLVLSLVLCWFECRLVFPFLKKKIIYF